MKRLIELTTKPFGFPIAFGTTNIVVRAQTSNRNGAATVNGVEVEESYREIIYRLSQYYRM